MFRTMSWSQGIVVAAVIAVTGLGAPPATAADPAIDGTVTLSSGAPLAEVRVDALRNGAVVASTSTNSSGGYAFDLTDGVYSLAFTPATTDVNPVSALWVEAPRNWPLDVVLAPPAAGRVFLTGEVALESGEPIAGGPVLFADSGNRSGSDGFFSMVQQAGTSGRWSFHGGSTIGNPAAGGTELGMIATGGPTMTMLQDTHTQLTVPVTTTTVTVRDGSGAPVPGATVRLNVGGFGKANSNVVLTPGVAPFSMSWTARAVSDANGVVALTRPVLAASVVGTLMVDAPSTRWVSVFRDQEIPPTGGAFTADLTTGRVTMSGTIRLADGSPVAGVTVIPTDPNARANGGNAADGNGVWTVSQPPGFTGNWALSTTRRTGSGLFAFSLKGGAMRTWVTDSRQDFTIPTQTVRVRVVDAAGRPVAGSVVAVKADGTTPAVTMQVPLLTGEPVFTGSWSASATTGADGVATLTTIATSNSPVVEITANQPPGSALNATVTSVSRDRLDGAVIPLASATRVTTSGRVTFSDGTPVPFAVIIPIDPASRVNGGNAADADGRYSVTKDTGFTGVMRVTTRPQASLSVKDPLTFALTSGARRTWASDATVDLTIPKTLYRLRVIDSTGNPLPHVTVGISANDTVSAPLPSVTVLPGEPAFTGWWGGRDVTGSDGIAQVPALAMDASVMTQVSVNPDPGSRFIPRTLQVRSSNLAETVIVLQSLPTSVTSMTPRVVAPGDEVTLTGRYLSGTSRVTIGGIPMEFTVDSDTKVRVRIASNAVSGPLQITAGSTVTPGAITVTSRDLQLTTTALPGGMVSSPYNGQLAATGGLAPYRWARTSGALPTGVILNTDGRLTGTPTRAMSATVGLTVTDARGTSVGRVITWTIDPKPATQPGPITRLTAAPAAGRVSLAWMAPVDNGGNVITGYRIERTTDGTTWETVIANTGATTLGMSLPAPPQVAYRYRVAAINAAGLGAYSDRSLAGPVAAFGVPSAPRSVTLVRSSNTQGVVTWIAPESNGGTPVTSYRVRTSPDGITWTTVVAATTSNRATISARSGTATWVQVAALNVAGFSPWTPAGPLR